MEMINYDKLSAQRSELAKTPEIWQFDLLTPEKLYQYSKDRGVPVLNADTIKDLWCIGILRSDLIISSKRLEIPSVEFISEDNDGYTYSDKRTVEHRANGYGGSFSNRMAEYDSVELLFHPFRLYVLYHVDRIFGMLCPTSTQYLLNPEGILTVSKYKIDLLNRSTAEEEFAERFENWNRLAELAIVLEPTAYSAVFHVLRSRYPYTPETLDAKLQECRENIRSLFSDFSVKDINKIRSKFCQAAELLDNNKMVHVLLRLMSQHERLKLRSTLGGSMQFLCMAEIIRRAAEDSLDQRLPEEDELGFGQWMPGARKTIYGTERILDSSWETRRDFLTSMGLDYGVKVRCYVEGDTEYGAFASAVGDAGGTEFINLRGHVVEKKGKGLSFAASLKNDQKSHIFSVVVMDQDREDHIRALNKAKDKEVFFGESFISSPDFEFANFTIDEMIDVLIELEGDNIQIPARDEIFSILEQAQSGKQFFGFLKKNGLFQKVGKGEAWGKALMKYALQHQEFPQEHKKAGEIRPAIEVARLLIKARDAGYIRSVTAYKMQTTAKH
jgi:hypothetical protein